MGKNVYLKTLEDQYDSHKKTIEGLQSRAATEKRELNADELRSVKDLGEKATSLFTQIEDLSEIEVRNAKVAAMASRVAGALSGVEPNADDDDDDDGQSSDDGSRSVKLGAARTQDRDPGFYTLGGRHSFLADQYRAATLGDLDSKARLRKHQNALRDNQHLRDVLGAGASTGGAGLVPPVWLAEQFAPILHRRLRVASFLRQVPWAGPFPWTIPIASTAASGTVVAEGINSTETDPTYTTITVTPSTIMGFSEVSRQMLEGSNPAVDAVIWADLMGDFFDRCETAVVTAIDGQAGITLVTVADTSVGAMRGGVLDAIAAVSDNSAGDADLFFGRNARWITYLKLADTALRPLILTQRYNPMNAVGEGGATQGFRSPVQGDLENLTVVTTPTVNASRGYVINSQEILYQNSPPMQFRFEQPAGPALIRVGIWGYMAVTAARRPKAITRIHYSAN